MTTSSGTLVTPKAILAAGTKSNRQLILAASLGTVFEWYDFYLYGSLAVFFSSQFFPKGSETAAFLTALATFGAGFAVRPLGAILFGKIGDTVGRKTTFLITIVIMGLSTSAVGILPTFNQIGWFSPIFLVFLRLTQGLALGGEYGGAAVYVAEHAPQNARGFQTSWIQTTATLGFFVSLAVILTCRMFLQADQFSAWGWRIPFLLSVLPLGYSVYVRLRLRESPVFERMQRQGELSESPVREALLEWTNLKQILITLLGAHAGVSVVFFTGQFYLLFFLTNTLKVPTTEAYTVLALGLLVGCPFIVFFGWLSDRVSRKWIMLSGCALAAITLFPIFGMIAAAANPQLADFQKTVQVTVAGADCNINIFASPSTDCDRATEFLTRSGVPYTMVTLGQGEGLTVTIGSTALKGFSENFYREALVANGYPTTVNNDRVSTVKVVALIAALMILVGMVYGPVAAFFVEAFPARIRYTSLSLSYHLGAGWFGGFAPFISTALATQTGNIYAGLWYPVVVCVLTVVVGALTLPSRQSPFVD